MLGFGLSFGFLIAGSADLGRFVRANLERIVQYGKRFA
jgi:hypothetical protein